MEEKFIYLAGPYTHEDPTVRAYRFSELTKKAGELMKQGHVVFSPITHGYPIEQHCELPGDYKFWRKQCMAFLDGWATEMQVLMLPGWNESVGVLDEIEKCKQIILPFNFIER